MGRSSFTRLGELLGEVVERLPASLRGRVTTTLLLGSVSALALSGVGQLLMLTLQVLLGRVLGTAEYGIYSYAMAWLGVGLILAKLGFDTALVRYVASYNSRNQMHRVRAVWRLARRRSLTFSLIAAPMLSFMAWKVAGDEAESLSLTLVLLAFLLPVASFSELASASLRGFKRIALSMWGDVIARPIVAGGVFVILWWTGVGNASDAMLAYLIGSVVAAVIAARFVRLQMGRGLEVADRRLTQIWMRFALMLMLANAFLNLLYTLDTIIIGILSSTTEAGLYAIASRVATFVLFVMNALQSIGAPLFVEAYARDRAGLRSVVRVFNLISVVAALPMGILLICLAEPLLGIFGSGFAAATPVLQILAGMQIFNVLTGPVGALLSMTGRQNQLAVLLAGALLVHVALCLLWVPRFGAMGAAWSAFIAHGLWNLAGAVLVRLQLGIDCSVLDWLRGSFKLRMA